MPGSLSKVSVSGMTGSDPTNSDAALSVEHRLDGSSQRFDVYPQRDARKFLPKLGGDLRDSIDWIEHVDHDRQFGLQAGRHALCPSLQQVDVRDDAAGVAQKYRPLRSELGIAAERSNNCTPIWSSRLLIVSLTTDCTRSSLREAAEKLPSSTAAMKVRS